MGARLPLFPEQASTLAPQTDHLYFYLLAVAVFFSVGIFLTIFYFAIRYRRRSEANCRCRAAACFSSCSGPSFRSGWSW